MKLLVASFLLSSFAGAAAKGTNKVGRSLKDLVPDMAELRRDHVHLNRMLELSPQCEADTDALYNNPELINAFSAWDAEFNENAVCDPDPASTTVECAFDSATLQSHQDLEEACTNVGGKVYLVDVELSCQISESGQTASFALDIENLPSCLAMSCDEANVDKLFGGLADELDQGYEDALGPFVESVVCTASVGGGGTTGTGGGGTGSGGGTTGTGADSTSSAYIVTGAVSTIMMALLPFAV